MQARLVDVGDVQVEFQDYYQSVVTDELWVQKAQKEKHEKARVIMWVEDVEKNDNMTVIQDYLDFSANSGSPTTEFARNLSERNIFCKREYSLNAPWQTLNESYSPVYTTVSVRNDSTLVWDANASAWVAHENVTTYYNVSVLTNWTTNLTHQALVNSYRNLTLQCGNFTLSYCTKYRVAVYVDAGEKQQDDESNTGQSYWDGHLLKSDFEVPCSNELTNGAGDKLSV